MDEQRYNELQKEIQRIDSEMVTQDQHQELVAEIKALDNKMDAQDDRIAERWGNWTENQNGKFEYFQEKMFEKMEVLRVGISHKSEMDSAIISKLSQLERRVEEGETQRKTYEKLIYENYSKISQVFDVLMKCDIGKMKVDLEAAHIKIRDHEDRIRPMEKREGRLAKAILERAAYIIVSIAAGWALHFLTR